VSDISEDQIEEVTNVIDLSESAPVWEELDPPVATQLEALLMVADQPLSELDLASIIGAPADVVADGLVALAGEYRDSGRGFDLRKVGEGWRYYSAPACSDVISRFATDGRSTKLTNAALETLAVVAYKQPVSRARVGAIRGVSVDAVMRTLMTRGLVAEIEIDPSTGAVLYGTTTFFLERLGISSLSELPPIEDHLPDIEVLDEFVDATN